MKNWIYILDRDMFRTECTLLYKIIIQRVQYGRKEEIKKHGYIVRYDSKWKKYNFDYRETYFSHPNEEQKFILLNRNSLYFFSYF